MSAEAAELHLTRWPLSLSATEVLLGAAELLNAGWCQGAAALDRDGRPVPVMSPEAASFSMLGALWRVAGDSELLGPCPAARLRSVCRTANLADWNDAPGRRAESVIAALRAAAGV